MANDDDEKSTAQRLAILNAKKKQAILDGTPLDMLKDEHKKKRIWPIKFNNEENLEETISCCFISRYVFIQVDQVYTHINGEYYVFIVKVSS